MVKFVIGYMNPEHPETTFAVTVDSNRAHTPEQAKELFEEQYKGVKVISVSKIDPDKLH